MSEVDHTEGQNSASSEDRRRFLERAGKVALAAPATALLLSAASKQAMSQSVYNNGRNGLFSPGNSGPNNNSPFP